MNRPSIATLERALAESFTRETARENKRDLWTPSTPHVGQDDITALLVLQYFPAQVVYSAENDRYLNMLGGSWEQLKNEVTTIRFKDFSNPNEPVILTSTDFIQINAQQYIFGNRDVLERFNYLNREVTKKLEN